MGSPTRVESLLRLLEESDHSSRKVSLSENFDFGRRKENRRWVNALLPELVLERKTEKIRQLKTLERTSPSLINLFLSFVMIYSWRNEPRQATIMAKDVTGALESACWAADLSTHTGCHLDCAPGR